MSKNIVNDKKISPQSYSIIGANQISSRKLLFFSLFLISIFCLTNIPLYAQKILKKKCNQKNRTIVAILDSGINSAAKEFKPYIIRSFDLVKETRKTGKDLNGHGTIVTKEFLNAYDGEPEDIEILNIKILNRHLATDAVKILNGLKIALENKAKIINLSAGHVMTRKEALLYCRKFQQLNRRYEFLLFAAAGNNGKRRTPKDKDIVFPQSCHFCNIPKKLLCQDILDDCIFLVEAGQLIKSNQLLIYLISLDPDRQIEEKAFKLMHGILYLSISLQFQQKNDLQKMKLFKGKSKDILIKILDWNRLISNIWQKK